VGPAEALRAAAEGGDDYLMRAYPRLLVADAAASERFYTALGFRVVRREGPFVHLRWARHADVFLVSMPAGVQLPGKRGTGVLLCFEAGEEVLEELSAQAMAAGASAVDGPTHQPWHTRELVVADPDGYRLAFVQRD
jgi:catechol 2,3-dioxygenase-like lactoylglutathione lyase family enzyme